MRFRTTGGRGARRSQEAGSPGGGPFPTHRGGPYEAPEQQTDEEDPLRRARAHLKELHSLLVAPTPESLEESVPRLQAAAECLRNVEGALRSGTAAARPTLLPELSELKRQVSLVQALLQQAAGFYFGCARLLAATAVAYTASGEPAVPAPPRRLRLEG